MKIIRLVLLITLFFGFIACDDKEQITEYLAIPKTDIGNKLVSGTDLISFISSDSAYSVTEGVIATEIKYLSSIGLAMKIFIFEVDLANPNTSIEVSTPSNSPKFTMQRMTEQAVYEDSPGHKVYAGVNADFFNTTTGVPQGILYKDGSPIKTTFQDVTSTYFAITKDKKALIAGQDVYNEIKGTFKETVGGRVWLVRDGVLSTTTDVSVEPRTCIGVSEDGLKVYVLAVDGRNFWYSNGMSYVDLGKCMKALGAYNSINLDGGGSTTFFVRNKVDFVENRFEIRNWPTDFGGSERAVANGLLLISNN